MIGASGIGAIASGIGALASGISAIGSNQRRKRRESELDAFAKQSPLVQESKSLNDYYQQALNRYNENPYQSQQYQLGSMNAQRATAQGIGALQDRRSAIGGISRLQANQMNAMQNLGAQAEAQRNARFGQLGGATQMKTAQDRYIFDINKMTPYNRQFGLKQLKSAAAAEEYSRDVNNTMSALNNAASIAMMGDGLSKKPKLSSNINLNPYSQMAVSPSEFGTNFINYSTPISANPSAFGTNFMEFNKNNKFKAPKGYKSF